MDPRVIVVTPASETPVTVAEAKLHCRVDHTRDDVPIAGFIATAAAWLEAYTGRAFVQRMIDLVWDGPALPAGPLWAFSAVWALEIPITPLVSVSSVTVTDPAGVSSVVSAGSYTVDTAGNRIVFAPGYVLPALRAWNAITVRCVVGYGAAVAVPAGLKNAVLLLVAALYDGRESAEIPIAARRLADPFRRY